MTFSRSFGLGVNERVQISLKRISTAIIDALNLLADTSDTVEGDLTEAEIATYTDTINGEII